MKHNSTILSWARISLGIITLLAITVQLISSIHHGRNLFNFFSFFTIESNLLAAGLLIAMGIYHFVGKEIKGLPYLRGAATLYMTMTGIIYVLFLSGNELALQTTIPAVNIVLHYVIPAAFLLDWIVFPPKDRMSIRIALIWLAYPLLYLIYSLVRGGFTDWYPYSFINPITNGWPNVIGMSLTLAVGVFVLTILIVARTSRRLRRRTI